MAWKASLVVLLVLFLCSCMTDAARSSGAHTRETEEVTLNS